MKSKEKTFGKIVSDARKSKNLNLRQCAALILKEDSTPISFQYLNDLENNRRNPPSEYIVQQISSVLEIPIEVLYFYAEIFPKYRNKNVNQSKIIEAYQTFSKILG